MRGLSAVKGKRVYMIDADLVDRAGPRIVDGVAEMAAKLHPKAFGRSQ
jgi:iron complex transport system substrate-binding protein